MIIVIESGAIYSAGLTALLISFALGSNGQYPALDAEMPLVGIAFNLIIVRVGLGLARTGQTPTITPSHRSASRRPTQHLHTNVSNSAMTSVVDHGTYPMETMGHHHAMSVKVTRMVHEKTDDDDKSGKWSPV